MLTILPSLAALESKDDGRLVVELRLARLRTQVAAARGIADHAEYLAHAAEVDGLTEQLVEEMARLGCRLLEAAGSLAEATCPEKSGIFVRRFADDRAQLGPPRNRA